MTIQSTYARLFLGFNEDISKLVVKYSRKSSSKPPVVLPITILSEEQVDQALADPHNASVAEVVSTAYVDYIEADRLSIKVQELEKDHRVYIEETLDTLTAKIKEAPPANRAPIQNSVETLNNVYRELNTLNDNLAANRKEHQEIKNDFATLLEEHDDKWKKYREENLTDLYSKLQKLAQDEHLPNLDTYEHEVKNLLREDTWQELKDRFIDLGAAKELPEAELEKILGLSQPSYETYFKVKAYLAIRAVTPNRDNMSAYMGKLKDFFKDVHTKGEQITSKQEQDIKALEEKKVKPLLEKIQSYNTSLTQLVDKTEKTIEAVASNQEKQRIREKVEQRITEVPQAPVPKP